MGFFNSQELTQDQLVEFHKYKHQSPKTTLEQFYVNTLLVPLEKAFPKNWSANAITILGQIPIILTVFLIWTENKNFGRIDDNLFFLVAVSIQWFSLFDVMDGMRARRTKTGTPLGRIVDEAMDQPTYACAGLAIGYMLRNDQVFYCISFSLINLPFYTMELKHKVCSNLHMIMGEIGPVELELVFTILFAFVGFQGSEIFEGTLCSFFGMQDQCFLGGLQQRHLYSVLVIFLLVIFTFDNLYDAFKKDLKDSLKLLIVPGTILLQLSNGIHIYDLEVDAIKYEQKTVWPNSY
ncbi:choline ethanolaminephosphotransferase 1 [Stylonychia lemnae]|uniref:Choline ethanolaminephosphotransferase 1 n=1 Tax=Stylonychia lemnae TaxID=5949 RepID=A0A078A4Q3_STYLE|nr:choline ethanolaminephosphotransferase 1 [Stylonychia lemnae]|eukprot:CDW75744.1 choline ethanolaminephosphotransferase 1 [Stylonychia lemnae]